MYYNRLDHEPGKQAAKGLLPNRYHLDCPFELLLLSVRPGDDGKELIFFEAASDEAQYVVYSAGDFEKEIGSYPVPYLHEHDCYEFMFVTEGEIYQNIDYMRHCYTSGSACLVSPEVAHSEEYRPQTNARLVFLKLQPDFLKQFLEMPRYFAAEKGNAASRCAAYFASDTDFLDFIPRTPHPAGENLLHDIFDRMTEVMLSPDAAASFTMAALLQRLLMFLFDSSLYDNTPIGPGSRSEQQLFQEVRAYMERQSCPVGRAELEKQFHYSGDYLYKVVKNHTGMSLYDYSARLCMKKAAALLDTTAMTVSEIAEAVGYRNFTQFYKMFEANFHMTPRAYRRRRST